jgi:hypothetical protein
VPYYLLPYDLRYPVVCFDEACKQLFGQVRPAQQPLPGSPAREDYEYERKGVCYQLLVCEPLRGGRHVWVSERRTRRDYALCVRDLVEVQSPQAKKIRLIQDNLNTHDGASLYEAFPPAEARRLLDKIEFHYTPTHASWLNRAETEISGHTAESPARGSASPSHSPLLFPARLVAGDTAGTFPARIG